MFVGPCIAKRKEARRDDMVDFVMTFEELHAIFKGMGIEMSEENSHNIPFRSIRTAHGFAQNGGVTAAVKAHVAGTIDFKSLQVANLTKKNVNLLRAFAKTGKAPAQFIEVMACEGGCISGPSVHTSYDAGRKRFNDSLLQTMEGI